MRKTNTCWASFQTVKMHHLNFVVVQVLDAVGARRETGQNTIGPSPWAMKFLSLASELNSHTKVPDL